MVVTAGGVDWKVGGVAGTLFEKTGGRRGMTGWCGGTVSWGRTGNARWTGVS